MKFLHLTFLLITVIFYYFTLSTDAEDYAHRYINYSHYFTGSILLFLAFIAFKHLFKIATFFKKNTLTILISLSLAVLTICVFFMVTQPQFRQLSDESYLINCSRRIVEAFKTEISVNTLNINGNRQVLNSVMPGKPSMMESLLATTHLFFDYNVNNLFYFNIILSIVFFSFVIFTIKKETQSWLSASSFPFIFTSFITPVYFIFSGTSDLLFVYGFFILIYIGCIFAKNPSKNNTMLLCATVLFFCYTRYEAIAISLLYLFYIALKYPRVRSLFRECYSLIILLSVFGIPLVWQRYTYYMQSNFSLSHSITESPYGSFSFKYISKHLMQFLEFYADLPLFLFLMPAIAMFFLSLFFVQKKSPSNNYKFLYLKFGFLYLFFIFSYVWGRSDSLSSHRLFIFPLLALSFFISFNLHKLKVKYLLYFLFCASFVMALVNFKELKFSKFNHRVKKYNAFLDYTKKHNLNSKNTLIISFNVADYSIHNYSTVTEVFARNNWPKLKRHLKKEKVKYVFYMKDYDTKKLIRDQNRFNLELNYIHPEKLILTDEFRSEFYIGILEN